MSASFDSEKVIKKHHQKEKKKRGKMQDPFSNLFAINGLATLIIALFVHFQWKRKKNNKITHVIKSLNSHLLFIYIVHGVILNYLPILFHPNFKSNTTWFRRIQKKKHGNKRKKKQKHGISEREREREIVKCE